MVWQIPYLKPTIQVGTTHVATCMCHTMPTYIRDMLSASMPDMRLFLSYMHCINKPAMSLWFQYYLECLWVCLRRECKGQQTAYLLTACDPVHILVGSTSFLMWLHMCTCMCTPTCKGQLAVHADMVSSYLCC